ncbi:MAG: hypothetical protein MK180_07615 [Rhodobacteraceae bacterium]|nr:hypothetical protein [Paracoccaceae bacterium]
MKSTGWITRCIVMMALGLSGAVQAQITAPDEVERFGLPEGCTGFVTVQYKLCQVTHHYTCEGDPEGIQHRVDLDDDGPFFVSTIDSEAQWIESLDVRSNILDTLDPAPENPASFTDLARKGRDDFNFSTTSEVGETIIYQGRDLLTGETVIIDDVPLLRTDTYARATRPDGTLVWESRGNEYIHLDWRLFLAGQSVTRTPDGSFQDEDEPVEFHFPGDPGFLALEPEYNCRALLL